VAGDTAATVSLAYDEACVLMLLGDREAARARLEVFLAAFPTYRTSLRRDPLFRGLFAGNPGGVTPAPSP
jgi:hypothetical protein